MLLCVAAASYGQVCATPGDDGSPTALSGVVNTYYPGTTATLSAGAKSVTVGGYNNSGASTPIAANDLVLIIQMQDATINPADTANYGGNNGTGAGYTDDVSSGAYEFVVAANAVPITGGTLTFTGAGTGGGLVNTYHSAAVAARTAKKTYQVIRVPQYFNVTLGGTVTAAPWNGTTGGIVVMDVAGTLNMNGGSIDVTGKGFRGGGGLQLTGSNTYVGQDYAYPAPASLTTDVGSGGSKGEGIAGTPRYTYDLANGIRDSGEGYSTRSAAGYGSFLRGAPGNAGGGGTDSDPATNSENSGGGGGGNGGAGGQGGYAWSSGQDTGGRGGARFAEAGATKIVMGGGGGAATGNNDSGDQLSGGVGGGIVIVRAGAVTGSGTVNANGTVGQSATNPGNDASGGGGAGGSVIFAARTGTLAGIAINANGGDGGDNWPSQAPGANNINAHGPGGGGGGGYVLQTGGASVRVAGGAHGVTTSGLLQYGAQDGSGGGSGTISFVSVVGVAAGTQCLPTIVVTKSTTTPSVSQGGSATYKIVVRNTGATARTAYGVNISDQLPQPVGNGFTYINNTTSVILNAGTVAATRTGTTNPTAGATNPTWGTFTIPPNAEVDVTFSVTVSASVPAATYQNPASATFLPTSTATVAVSSSYDPTTSTTEDVQVGAQASVTGFVYSDLNHNTTKDSSETGTGVALYVKLVPTATPTGPATLVAPANTTTGAYTIGSVSAGTYTLVLDTNNTLADVTPGVPAGWTGTENPSGTFNITVNATSAPQVNFGLFAGAALSGTVFNDNSTTAGLANNGAMDSGEAGLPGVMVKVTNDAGTTTYDTTYTDATGKYTLMLPGSVTTVATVLKVVETNASEYISTGASIGTAGGAYTRSTDTLRFTTTIGTSSYTGVNFGDVRMNSLLVTGANAVLPGAVTFYPHRFIANTTGAVSFTLSHVASPNTPGYSQTLYEDTNCDGNYDGSELQITAAVNVNAGKTLCLLVKEFVPTGAPLNATDASTLSATFTYTNSASPALTATYSVQDITTVGASTDAGLRLEKLVDKTTARPGDTLVYTITFTNDSSKPLGTIVVSDMTPAYTTLEEAVACPPLAALPADLTGCTPSAPSVGGTGAIKWTFTGTLRPSQAGTVTFSVRVAN